MTFLHKRVFPLVGFGIAVFFMTIPFLAPSIGGTTTGSPFEFVLVPVFMIVVGYFMMKKLVFDLVDEVLDAGDALVIRNGHLEERVALSDIINVSYSQFVHPPRVTLSLRNPTLFGDRVSFCPPASFMPFSTNPIVDELIRRVDAARRGGPTPERRPQALPAAPAPAPGNAVKSVSLWIVLVAALVGLFAILNDPALRLRLLPPRSVIVKPIAPDSELWRLMQDARAASQANDHQHAAELFTQALAIEPGPNNISRDLLAERGSEYNYLSVPDKAFADYDAALRIGYPGPMSDDAVRAYMGRGYALYHLKQYRRAKDDFDVVLKELPSNVPRSSSTLGWRGTSYQSLGDPERAVADYKAALALDPNNTTALNGLKSLGKLP
jgi:hypothetical protein